MIITDVTTIKLHYDMSVPMADAIHYMPARPTLLVQVHTDSGITGLGEAAAYGGALAGSEAIILNELRQTIVGQDPFRIERLWSMMTTRAPAWPAWPADDGNRRDRPCTSLRRSPMAACSNVIKTATRYAPNCSNTDQHRP
jgi:L-alanine-DL-glutamate epimerase-like enolase superfamily enzyme